MEMTHKCEELIKCPHCNSEDINSWEFNQDSGIKTCEDCGKDFYVKSDIVITYSTRPLNKQQEGNNE